MEATRSARQVQVAVGAEPDVWPLFQQRAQEWGVAAVLSTPMVTTPGSAIGALNIYTHDKDGFDEDERRTAELLCEQAAMLVGNALDLQTVSQLNAQLQAGVGQPGDHRRGQGHHHGASELHP